MQWEWHGTGSRRRLCATRLRCRLHGGSRLELQVRGSGTCTLEGFRWIGRGGELYWCWEELGVVQTEAGHPERSRHAHPAAVMGEKELL